MRLRRVTGQGGVPGVFSDDVGAKPSGPFDPRSVHRIPHRGSICRRSMLGPINGGMPPSSPIRWYSGSVLRHVERVRHLYYYCLFQYHQTKNHCKSWRPINIALPHRHRERGADLDGDGRGRSAWGHTPPRPTKAITAIDIIELYGVKPRMKPNIPGSAGGLYPRLAVFAVSYP